jgi:hypothetical protein
MRLREWVKLWKRRQILIPQTTADQFVIVSGGFFAVLPELIPRGAVVPCLAVGSQLEAWARSPPPLEPLRQFGNVRFHWCPPFWFGIGMMSPAGLGVNETVAAIAWECLSRR